MTSIMTLDEYSEYRRILRTLYVCSFVMNTDNNETTFSIDSVKFATMTFDETTKQYHLFSLPLNITKKYKYRRSAINAIHKALENL